MSYKDEEEYINIEDLWNEIDDNGDRQKDNKRR